MYQQSQQLTENQFAAIPETLDQYISYLTSNEVNELATQYEESLK